MGKFKRLVAVLFCCATLIHSQPAKAFWPVFDFIDTVPIFSQISTVIDSLKNLKEQLVQLKENLKALGDQISSIAAFAKEIGDTISEAASVIAEGVNFVNETLGTDFQLGEKLVAATEGITNATNTITDAVVGGTNQIVAGMEKGMNNITSPTLPEISKPVIPEMPSITRPTIPSTRRDSSDGASRGENTASSDQTTETPTTNEPKVTEPVIAPKETILPNLPKVTKPIVTEPVVTKPITPVIDSPLNELPTTPVNDKPAVTLPKAPVIAPKTLKPIDFSQKGLSNPVVVQDVEEEEEEEEVTVEEENLQIEAVKENINTALNESKILNIQFNDLLDVSINTVQDNSEQNNKAIEMMSYAIKMAENLKEEEKKIFQTEINSIKEKQQAVSVRLIDIIEGVKENYNTEYKNKIEDGYKNYEKIAIAYIRGDATKDELNSLGEKLKKDSASIDVTPDSGVMKAVNNEIRMLQENLIKLHQKVKETELKNMNANS